MQKTAVTDHPIHEILAERWSPRAFAGRPVERAKLLSLFEAARWSPSAANSQPWAFLVFTQDDPENFAKMVETLKGFNRVWAAEAPVLVLALAKLPTDAPQRARYAYYDLGQAMAHLSVQAGALGLHVHQMAGFDGPMACQLFELPEDYEPVAVSAIGYLGEPDRLPDELKQRELAPRNRKPLPEFVFEGRWNHPLEP
jgi:nitroreductase